MLGTPLKVAALPDAERPSAMEKFERTVGCVWGVFLGGGGRKPGMNKLLV